MTDNVEWYLGVDWGGQEHALCLLDATGRVVAEWRVAHTAPAIHAALQAVLAHSAASPARIAVGLETPRGVLVDTFLEHGFPVFALNPKQLDRFRDRFSAGGAKDDRRDARVVGDALRTDRRAFRPVHPDDPQVIQLRELSRLLEELQQEEGRLVNRLRDQLSRVHAPWLTVCPAADEPWLWSLLDTAPSPAAWPRLSRRRLTAVLRAHRIRRLTAEDLRTTLRQPTLSVAPGVGEAVATRLAALIPRLRLTYQQRVKAEHAIDRALETLATAEAPDGESREHRDVQILRSLPGVGRMVAATMLTDAAGPLAARDYATLRTHAGTAPVTRRSAKRTFNVHMRHACNGRLRNALYHWSRTSIQHDGPARAYYDVLRAKGHQHARALRSVADRWLRILVAMLTTGTLYDPSRLRPLAPQSA